VEVVYNVLDTAMTCRSSAG